MGSSEERCLGNADLGGGDGNQAAFDLRFAISWGWWLSHVPALPWGHFQALNEMQFSGEAFGDPSFPSPLEGSFL